MKLAIILSTRDVETNWNALRLGNFALNKGDTVSMFLTGEGVEYDKDTSTQFNIKEQLNQFLASSNAKLIACETCMNFRERKDSRECPVGGIEDLYNLIADNDKVITF